MFFEEFSLVIGRAAWRAAVDEVQRPAVRGEHAHGAPFHHPVEIARPRLRQLGEREPETSFFCRRLRGQRGREACPHYERSHCTHRRISYTTRREWTGPRHARASVSLSRPSRLRGSARFLVAWPFDALQRIRC